MNNARVSQFMQTEVSIKDLELITINVPQKEVFRSAIGTRNARKALIIKWTNNNDIVGWGECSCRADPFYSHEYIQGAKEVIKEFIFPLIRQGGTYAGILESMGKVRGWHFTKAAIEFAMNDVIRRETGEGIIEKSGFKQLEKVPVGISLGIFDSVSQLKKKLDEVKNDQYHRLKFKISPDYNKPEILDHLADLNHPNISFDANGSFTAKSFAILAQFAQTGNIIEQPFPPSENFLMNEYLKTYTPFKICLDEDIESYGDLVSLVASKDEVNIKPGRVGGLYNALRMIDFCETKGLKAWIGGMFETGIGRAQNLQLAALISDAEAHDLSPSSRYFQRDILEKPITMDRGFINNIDFDNIVVDEIALYEMTVERQILKA